MSSTDDILKQVSFDEVPQLLETLKKDWRKYYPLYQFITIYKEYTDSNVENPRQTLLRYGNVEDGVYIVETIFHNEGNPYTNFFTFTASKDVSDVRKVLLETLRIPWHSHGYSFHITFKSIAPVVHEVATLKGVDLKWAEGHFLWMPPEESLNISDIPDEVELRYLNSSHVPEINQNWPNKFPGSEFYLEEQIRNNFGLGLFRKDNNKMVSSAVSYHSGGIFVLATDPDFRRKGYAEIVVQNMTKELRHRGRIPFALVDKSNISSQKLFKKIGFQMFTETEHIFPKTFRHQKDKN